MQSLARTEKYADEANEVSAAIILELRRQHEEELSILEGLGSLHAQIKRAKRDLVGFMLRRLKDRALVFLLLCVAIGIILAVVLTKTQGDPRLKNDPPVLHAPPGQELVLQPTGAAPPDPSAPSAAPVVLPEWATGLPP